MHYQSLIIQTTTPLLTPQVLDWVRQQSGVAVEEQSPDLMIIEPEKSIGVSNMKQLIQWNAKQPFDGQFKLAIIHQADRMTVPAQNSLLKTLEEPASNTLICLVAKNLANLLPTIISRSQVTSVSSEQEHQLSSEVQDFLQTDYLGQLDLVNHMAKRGDHRTYAIEFLHELLRHQVHAGQQGKLIRQAIKALKSNTNFKLTMESMVLGLNNQTRD